MNNYNRRFILLFFFSASAKVRRRKKSGNIDASVEKDSIILQEMFPGTDLPVRISRPDESIRFGK